MANDKITDQHWEDCEELTAKALADGKAYMAETAEQGWEPLPDKNDIKAFKKALEGQTVPLIRGEGYVKGTQAQVREIFSRTELSKQGDARIKNGRVVASKYISKDGDKIDRLAFVYQSYKSPWPVSDRDFASASRMHTDEDGTVWIVYVKYDVPDVPVVKGTVRGEVFLTCYRIAASDKDGHSKVTAVIGVNPNGSIPGMIVKKVATENAQLIAMMHKVATKIDLTKIDVHHE